MICVPRQGRASKQRCEVKCSPDAAALPLNRIGNGDLRVWVSELLTAGLSAATVRKADFALRQCLGARGGRLAMNPACEVPLPSERQKSPCFLSRAEVEQLVEAMPARYAALILVGAYAGLRWGETVGLRRRDIDITRSRIRVSQTAVEVRARITLDNHPKTTRSIRSVPVTPSVMRRLQDHLDNFVGPSGEDLVFAAAGGSSDSVFQPHGPSSRRDCRGTTRDHLSRSTPQLRCDHGCGRL
jgi:integrase